MGIRYGLLKKFRKEISGLLISKFGTYVLINQEGCGIEYMMRAKGAFLRQAQNKLLSLTNTLSTNTFERLSP